MNINVILKIIVSKRYVDYASPGEEKPSDEWRDSLRAFLELSGMFVVSDVGKSDRGCTDNCSREGKAH
jgi:hypothetical protein